MNVLSVQDGPSKLKRDLLDSLSDVKSPGSFAAFGPLSGPLPADIFVNGIGEIKMPLNEVQARELISKCRRAPYGKGSETIVDTQVRNTWELDAEEITFKNPSWPKWVQKLSALVAEKLGINTTIKAELYKMLLYEPSSMFKPHTE